MRYDLTAIIKGLLFRHDCVIVPGFGGFILNYVPAVIEKSTGMFYPPARRVSFNRNLTHNDGLLIGSVSNQHGINYGEARDIVDKFASELKKVLSRGGEVEFEQIGIFRTNQEGGIQFEPDRNANYNLGSYGMESFRCPPVAGYDVRKKVMKAGRHVAPSGTPVRKLLVRAAVAIPVLIALVVVPLKTDIFGTRLERTSLNPLAQAQLENNRKAIDEMPVVTGTTETDAAATPPVEASAETVSTTASGIASVETGETVVTTTTRPSGTEAVAATPTRPTAAENVAATPTRPTPSETVATTPTPQMAASEYNFVIIAGSFKSVENAKVMASRLKTMGYEPQLMNAPDNYTRVAAKGFSDLGSALSERNRLATSIEGLWILRMR